MGLEIQVVDSDKDINIAELYAIADAVRDKFDWQLKGDKRHAHNILTNQASHLTKGSVIDMFSGIEFNLRPSEERELKYLSAIPETTFTRYLSILAKSVMEFNESNTHLEFDYESFPQTELTWCCSWSMRTVLERCEATWSNSYRDYVLELDEDQVIKTAKKWRGIGWKLKVARWIGYFNPEAAERMSEDIADQMELTDAYCNDVNSLSGYRNFMLKILKNHKKGKRIWLISSY